MSYIMSKGMSCAHKRVGPKKNLTFPAVGRGFVPAGSSLVPAGRGSRFYLFSLVRAVRQTVLIAVVLALVTCDWFVQPETGGGKKFPDIVPATVTPNDTDYAGNQDNLDLIGMPGAWAVLQNAEISSRVRTAVVAVLDSGVETAHPDIGTNSIPGWDFVMNTAISSSDTVPGADNHGTHVAGILGAVTHNTAGIAGVGWNTLKILPVRVLNGQNGTIEDLLQGILYAAALTNNSKTVPSRRVNVINMSLGSSQELGNAVETAIRLARDKGITVVAASGNSGLQEMEFPAGYDEVLAVGAVNNTGTRAPFSNWGAGLAMTAPGVGIYSTVTGGGYAEQSGTSMATPHVAGVAGLLYAVSRDMTPEGVAHILRTTAEHPRNTGWDGEYGWGILRADRAVRRALMEPYGPYRYDKKIVGSSMPDTGTDPAPSVRTPLGESLSGDAAVRTGLDPVPEPGTYRPDRLILVLDRPWVDSVLDGAAGGMTGTEAGGAYRTALEDIRYRYGFFSIHGENPVFQTAVLAPGQDVVEVAEQLIAEDIIESISYDKYVYLR
jgi:hypothetical protein